MGTVVVHEPSIPNASATPRPGPDVIGRIEPAHAAAPLSDSAELIGAADVGVPDEPAARVRSGAVLTREQAVTLWDRQRRLVATILLAHKPAEADLDDLMQDVASAVVAKLDTLSDAGAFVPWLRTIAVNAARASGRRWTVRRRSLARGLDPHDGEALGRAGGAVDQGSADSSAAREEGARLMRLAQELPDGYREPLLLRVVHDLSYAQIGAILDLPETTVETRIARGRRMLRERAVAAAASGPGSDQPAVTVHRPTRIWN
ncbi:MAG: hypothetical protein C0468_00155 [Planctomyces sp.]|nr:hypothetical protein [Planctomyces sp.]MBA4119319.1 hypothetical protein [Isosphaera sp.]